MAGLTHQLAPPCGLCEHVSAQHIVCIGVLMLLNVTGQAARHQIIQDQQYVQCTAQHLYSIHTDTCVLLLSAAPRAIVVVQASLHVDMSLMC